MTFWDALKAALTWAADKWTRILGVAIGTLATLTGTGIIPDAHLKYYMAGMALLTYWRGSATGQTYQQAKAVLSANPSNPPTLQPEKKS